MSGERLTQQQEQELVIGAEGGDSDACRKLVEAFLPAIAGSARRFPTGIGVEREELLQEGVAGLLFAARRYDPRLGTPFWPYASFWVRKAMQELVAEMTRPVGLSDRAVRSLAHIRVARREHLRAHRTEPTVAELSGATGLSPSQLESLLAAERTPRGMEEPLGEDGEGRATVGDAVVDPIAEQAYGRVLDRIEMTEVRASVDGLDERERVVLLAHYGLGQPVRTLTQIGDELRLTAERTRQIEAGALKKLREALARPAAARTG